MAKRMAEIRNLPARWADSFGSDGKVYGNTKCNGRWSAGIDGECAVRAIKGKMVLFTQMRFGLRLFLVFSLLVPTGPVNAFSQKPSEECAICGHVCCCPEMCAPKIKELKEKQSRAHSGCDQGFSKCRLQSSETPSGLINTRESITFSNPQVRILSVLSNTQQGQEFRIYESDHICSFPISFEIPTPPPKFSTL